MTITASTAAQPAKRELITTILVWLGVVLGLTTVVLVIIGLTAKGANAFSVVVSLISLLLSVGLTVGPIMILKWRMQGFRVIIGCHLLRIVLVLIQTTPVIPVILYAAVYLAILYFILQFPTGNKAWSHLV